MYFNLVSDYEKRKKCSWNNNTLDFQLISGFECLQGSKINLVSLYIIYDIWCGKYLELLCNTNFSFEAILEIKKTFKIDDFIKNLIHLCNCVWFITTFCTFRLIRLINEVKLLKTLFFFCTNKFWRSQVK